MECIFDPACQLPSALQFILDVAMMVDFIGHAWFGDDWSALTPDLVAGIDTLARVFGSLGGSDAGMCAEVAQAADHHG